MTDIFNRVGDDLLVPEVVRGMTLVFQNLFSEKVTIKSEHQQTHSSIKAAAKEQRERCAQ